MPIIFFYAISMFLYPWLDGGGDWNHVHSVWNTWQSLNVGMLAFLSSVIALNISRFNSNKQRERNFVAARAFLPEALSDLTLYFKSSGNLFKEAWYRAKQNSTNSPLKSQIPDLPKGYREIFSKCIAFAEPEVGNHLAFILMRLQVHHSRMQGLSEDFCENSNAIIIPQNIISYFYCLGELQVLINKTFEFARGLEVFNSNKLTFIEFKTAYNDLGIISENYDDLDGFTKRTIDRRNK